MRFEAQQSAMAMRRWRESLGFSQRDAASALGLALKNYQFLEWGENRERRTPLVMNQRIALACAAIASGLEPIYGLDVVPRRRGQCQEGTDMMVSEMKDDGVFQKCVGLALSQVIADKASRGESVVGVILHDAELRAGRLCLEVSGLSDDEQNVLGGQVHLLLKEHEGGAGAGE